jgi:hypothetical protein
MPAPHRLMAEYGLLVASGHSGTVGLLCGPHQADPVPGDAAVRVTRTQSRSLGAGRPASLLPGLPAGAQPVVLPRPLFGRLEPLTASSARPTLSSGLTEGRARDPSVRTLGHGVPWAADPILCHSLVGPRNASARRSVMPDRFTAFSWTTPQRSVRGGHVGQHDLPVGTIDPVSSEDESSAVASDSVGVHRAHHPRVRREW